VLAQTMPEYFWRTTSSGELEFAVPGWDVRSAKYVTALSLRKAPLSDKINLRTITNGLSNPSSLLAWDRYLMERGDTRVKDWASWVPNATFKTEEEMVRAMNAAARNVYRVIRTKGTQKGLLPKMQTRAELYESLNYK